MKTYAGMPKEPRLVMVLSIDKALRLLAGGPFHWGKAPTAPAHMGVTALSVAILLDVLGPDQRGRVQRLASRFAWRGPKLWRDDATFQITESEVREIVRQIEEVDAEAAGQRARIANEIAPRVSDGGIGPGGSPIVWGKK